MNGWRLLGRAILVSLDALVAGVLAGLFALLATPIVYVGDSVVLAVTVGGVVTGLTLGVAMALAGAGRRPFPATRTINAASKRLPWWWH